MPRSPNVDVTFLGHSTVLLEFDPEPGARRTRFLTDPVLRGRVGPLVWHGDPEGARHAPVDAVLISHAHHDHLDLPSLDRLRAAGEQPRLIVPAGIGPLLRRRGFLRVVEVVAGDRLAVGDALIRVIHAEHDGRRRPFGPSAGAVGYVVDAGPRVYFAGDTGLYDRMSDLAGSIDVALLPVWGWGPRLGPGHLDPVAAAEAARRLAVPIAVPVHWGGLYPPGLRKIWPGLWRDPAREFARQVRTRRLTTEVRVLLPGERTTVSCDVPELLEVAW